MPATEVCARQCLEVLGSSLCTSTFHFAVSAYIEISDVSVCYEAEYHTGLSI